MPKPQYVGRFDGSLAGYNLYPSRHIDEKNLEEYNKNKIIVELDQLKLELQNYQAEDLYYNIISNKIDRYKASLECMDN